MGGKSALPMESLVTLLEDIGAQQIRTYIQSGNAVFTINNLRAFQFSDRVETEIQRRYGIRPHVIMLRSEEIERAIAANPFLDDISNPSHLHLGFLSKAPVNPDLEALEALKDRGEQFRLIGRVFYLYAPEGVGRSRLAANVEKILGVPMTDRNWRTVCKINEMVSILTSPVIHK